MVTLGFQLEILEYCEPRDTIEREQYYIDLLVPVYNILKTAGSRLGQNHSEDAKQAIRDALKARIISEEANKN